MSRVRFWNRNHSPATFSYDYPSQATPPWNLYADSAAHSIDDSVPNRIPMWQGRGNSERVLSGTNMNMDSTTDVHRDGRSQGTDPNCECAHVLS